MRWAVLLIPLALTGCASHRAAERAAAEQASGVADDAKCLSLGVPKGSQPYVTCRLQLAHDRSVSAAIAHAQDQETGRQMMAIGAGMMQGN